MFLLFAINLEEQTREEIRQTYVSEKQKQKL